MNTMPPAAPSSHFTPAAHTERMQMIAEASERLERPWREMELSPELTGSILTLVHATHAPLDRIADDHRRFRERYNIGSAK